ncbi:MAG: archaellin/type IV pilin N-terminal domain-containing protein [Nanoarchaeota archaeon]
MMGMKKRGLSPVIATTLLVSVALVLAVIIFMWARSFVEESIEKDGQHIELVCEDVFFVAEARAGQLFIQNTANVPIYAIEMRIKGEGEIAEIELPEGGGTVGTGETMNFTLPTDASSGKTVVVVPILLGETDEDKVPHICDIEYGVEAVVE